MSTLPICIRRGSVSACPGAADPTAIKSQEICSKTGRLAIIVATLLLLWAHPAATQMLLSVALDGALACRDPSQYQTLFAELGKASYQKDLAAAILAEQCTILRRGEDALVVDFFAEQKLIKIQRPGFRGTYWTSEHSLERHIGK